MKKRNTIKKVVAIFVLIIIIFGVYWMLLLRKAHATFENYYAFRGCTQLIEKADTYGVCKTVNGDTIKIVEINNRWYLDGDGPGVF